MQSRYTLEIIAVLVIGIFCILFLVTSAILNGDGFSGTDSQGSKLISELSGTPADDVQPLVPQWKPPGREVESGLFALQAAIGGILVGGVFGYWIGQKKKA
jgi:cobalt/nickel transport protein